MRDKLGEFAELYERRPFRDNPHGMRSPHLFPLWFLLRQLNPTSIIESGVYQGLGTWFIEQSCPDAQLHCIDPDLSQRRYISTRAKYYEQDFSQIDWSALNQERTVLFFDDHQNAMERVRICSKLGFSDLIFEDNYPTTRGDCYSLKKVFAQAGFNPPAKRGFTGWIEKMTQGSKPPEGFVAPGPRAIARLLRNSSKNSLSDGIAVAALLPT